jgi:hypothetical protein
LNLNEDPLVLINEEERGTLFDAFINILYDRCHGNNATKLLNRRILATFLCFQVVIEIYLR